MKVGSLCTGYGGLEMGLKEVFPSARLAWVADNDKAASTLLAARYPGVPNLGDIKAIDWSTVERVDLLAAGIPCQPYSLAGSQKGSDDDRDLVGAFLEGVRILRPKIVILENVPGFRKGGLPEFSGAFPRWGFMCDGIAYELPKPAHLIEEKESLSLPTPRTTDANGAGLHGSGGKDLRTAVKLLPTPTTRNGEGNQVNNYGTLLLPGVAIKLLPTPTVALATGGQASRSGSRKNEKLLSGIAKLLGANMRQPSDDKSACSVA